MIHDGSSRNRQDAMRDGHAERRGTKAYLKQYVAVTRSEPVRLAAAKPRLDWSQRRIGGCSRSVHESCGLERPRTQPKLFFISSSPMLGNPDQSCGILVRNKLAHATAPSDRTFLVDTAGHTPVAFHHRVRNLPAHHPFHRAALFECCLCKVFAQASTTAQRIE